MTEGDEYIHGETQDEAWSRMHAQIVFRDERIRELEADLARQRRLNAGALMLQARAEKAEARVAELEAYLHLLDEKGPPGQWPTQPHEQHFLSRPGCPECESLAAAIEAREREE